MGESGDVEGVRGVRVGERKWSVKEHHLTGGGVEVTRCGEGVDGAGVS